MENYEVMAISEILYHLYDTADFMQRQQQVLSMTRRFLSCSFASILHAGEPKPGGSQNRTAGPHSAVPSAIRRYFFPRRRIISGFREKIIFFGDRKPGARASCVKAVF